MDLCLICCSKEIKVKTQNKLSTNLNAFFLLRHLLQVPVDPLVINLRDYGNPENWIDLCDQCSQLVNQAEQLYCKIVQTEIQLRTVRKSIIERTKSSIATIGINSDDANENILSVKTESWEEYGKRKDIWETTRSFTKDFDYSELVNITNPFTQMDELANFILNEQKRNHHNNNSLNIDHLNCTFDNDEYFDDDNSVVESENIDDKPEFKYKMGDKPTKKTSKNPKSSKKWAPIKRPTIDGKYKCNFCDKLFEKRGTCNAHEAQKHRSKPYQFICDICGKSWNNNKSLVSHRWGVHRVKVDGTTLAALPKRKYVTKPRTTDKVYKRMVNIDGKWKCRHCDKLFNTKVGCYGHEATKHKTTPGHFVCDICGKAWNSNNALVKHKWGIHKVRVDGTPIPRKPKIMEEPQLCNICGKRFSSRKSVKNHVRYVHKNETEIK